MPHSGLVSPPCPYTGMWQQHATSKVRAPIDVANGLSRGRTQDSDAAHDPGGAAFRRDRVKRTTDRISVWPTIRACDSLNTALSEW